MLRAEGALDEDVPARLAAALAENAPVDEIWIRSPGGMRAPATSRPADPQVRHPDAHPGGLGLLFGLQLHVHGRADPLCR